MVDGTGGRGGTGMVDLGGMGEPWWMELGGTSGDMEGGAGGHAGVGLVDPGGQDGWSWGDSEGAGVRGCPPGRGRATLPLPPRGDQEREGLGVPQLGAALQPGARREPQLPELQLRRAREWAPGPPGGRLPPPRGLASLDTPVTPSSPTPPPTLSPRPL